MEDEAFEDDEELEESQEPLPIGDLDRFVLRQAKKPFRKLKKAEERELILAAQQGDRAALDKLARSQFRFMTEWAYKFLNRGVPLCDLIQEAFLGLHEAILKWNPDKDCRLNTFANIYIKSRVYRAYLQKGRMVKISPKELGKQKKRRKFDALEHIYEQGSAPVAHDGKMKPFTMDFVSFFQTGSVPGDDQLPLHERIRSDIAAPDEMIDVNADFQYVRDLILRCGLDEQQIEFISVKWGLWDGVVQSVEEMATIYRWDLDRTKAYHEDILQKIYAEIDPGKLSGEYFDKRAWKRLNDQNQP